MAVKSIEKNVKSSLENVKKAVSEILEFLDSNIINLSKEDFLDLKLVLNELIINSVIHGNNNDISKTVKIYIEVSSENIIKATISDEGKGYNYNKYLIKEQKQLSFDENGRGIALVSALIDTITFNDIGNTVKFTKKVSINEKNSYCG